MKIVIIGDGKVGYKLAKQLSSEKYDIILIDNNEEKLRKSIERMDVFCVVGEGGSVMVHSLRSLLLPRFSAASSRLESMLPIAPEVYR